MIPCYHGQTYNITGEHKLYYRTYLLTYLLTTSSRSCSTGITTISTTTAATALIALSFCVWMGVQGKTSELLKIAAAGFSQAGCPSVIQSTVSKY